MNSYEHRINSLRMTARGIDRTIFDALNIQEEDVSVAGQSGELAGVMVPMMAIFCMILGAFYLAIDVTAGERERLSLESLLSLPASRFEFVAGKYLAIVAFMLVALVVCFVTLGVSFSVIPEEKLGGVLTLNVITLLQSTLLLLPLLLLLGGALMTISAYTKSTKEAQTYLGVLMVLPMAPYFVMQFKTIASTTGVMATPILSQYKILDKLFKQEPIETLHYALSSGTTLVLAVLLFWMATKLYSQDRILQ